MIGQFFTLRLITPIVDRG